MSANRVIQRCGRLTLTQSEQGFWWGLTSRAGAQWCWDPTTRQFTGACRVSPTQAVATAGLEWTLAHEAAGDLDEQEPASPRLW